MNKKKICELGIVGCSRRKLTVPAPAYLLYSASPTFSLAYQLAKIECDEVLILSGKFGLIKEDSFLSPYDLKLTEERASQLASSIKTEIEHQQFRVYAMGLYKKILLELPKSEDAMPGDIITRAKNAGQLGRLKPHNWPMTWILEEVWKHKKEGYPLLTLKEQLETRGYQEPTIKAQMDRAIKCPLHKLYKSRLFRKEELEYE